MRSPVPRVPEAYLVEAVRTPSGRARPDGALAQVHPADLLAHVLAELVDRVGVDPHEIDDVLAGCVTQAGEQAMNIGRSAVLGAGLPESVPATTIDRQCGSSQQAVHFAAQAVLSGTQDIVIACGVESMSHVPMWLNWLDDDPYGGLLHRRYPEGLVLQGVAAEIVAARHSISRESMDEFAARSHQRAEEAAVAGWFDREILGISTPSGTVTADETVRAGSTTESLSGLRPAFQDDAAGRRHPEIDWRVTAGNSSPLTDGASAVMVMGERAVSRLGVSPMARVHALAVAGDSPEVMLTAVVPATQKVLDRSGLSIEDIDVSEVNEAFACVPLLWQRHFRADDERLNPAGGAIALGHPLGASGTRLLTTLLGTLERTGGRYGLQTMCEAGGLANALVVENLARTVAT